MVLTCRQCSRANPPGALYCYHDGLALDAQAGQAGPLDVGKQGFLAPFIFPSGQSCNNFDELALACNRCWNEARELLKAGFLGGFFTGLSRADLVATAREAVNNPDLDQGLDELLSKFPSEELIRPRLSVTPKELNLGTLTVGKDVRTVVELCNDGGRLLRGSAVVRFCDWLHIGEEGAVDKVFQFREELSLTLVVHGKALRASTKPLEGAILLDTNGGIQTIRVRAQLPVTPFPEGTLAGAKTPREAAAKARAAPRDAAPLFESGAVARWYERNGWSYPVPGPASTGLGAVQQFFEALGLVQPPTVEINTTSVTLSGKPGERVQASLRLSARQPRPIYAHAVSDQPWLSVGKILLGGNTAGIPLVAAVPDQPGETLRATVKVTSNGQQRFEVAVSLDVAGLYRVLPLEPAPVALEVVEAVPVLPEVVEAVPVAPEVVEAVPILPVAVVDEEEDAEGVPLLAQLDPDSWSGWVHATPIVLLCTLLLGVLMRDVLTKPTVAPPPEIAEEIDPYQYVGILFHDKADGLIDAASQRFGLVLLREKERLKKLTFDEMGRTSNVCVKLDGQDYLFGQNLPNRKPGNWQGTPEPLGAGRLGERCVWLLDGGNLAVTQEVEIIVGPQTRRKDTCLVRYKLVNRGSQPHQVGLRVLLDTFVGARDGVAFTIPGEKELCDTSRRFELSDQVPDFLQALERQNLDEPGAVAQVQMRVGGRLEPPESVTLGCWPSAELSRRGLAPTALGHLTGWDVPVLPMGTLGDSAVTLYWIPKGLAPGATREVGFAYGLGVLASSGAAKGKLALTAGGSFLPGGTFTVTAYVANAELGQGLKLDLPPGFTLVGGEAIQALRPAGAGRTSPLTWRVRSPQRAEVCELKVTSNSGGLEQKLRVPIQSNRLLE